MQTAERDADRGRHTRRRAARRGNPEGVLAGPLFGSSAFEHRAPRIPQAAIPNVEPGLT
jgi:hypothetical protein